MIQARLRRESLGHLLFKLPVYLLRQKSLMHCWLRLLVGLVLPLKVVRSHVHRRKDVRVLTHTLTDTWSSLYLLDNVPHSKGP
jgi:hypothetical protein